MLELVWMVPMALGQVGQVAEPVVATGGSMAEAVVNGISVLGGVLGAGLIVLGAARGIGNLASSATEAIARQPEAGNRIFTTMIIAAALIEGVTLFALIICLMAVFR